MEYLTIFRDFAISGAAIVTTLIAWLGLKNWNLELRGKADFEVARSLIRATYKLRDELWQARSMLILPSDVPDNADHKKKIEAYTDILTDRLQPVSEALQEYEAQVLEVEALWGSGIRHEIPNLRICVIKLRLGIFAEFEKCVRDGSDFQSNSAWGNRGDEKDLFSIQIDNSVSTVEKEVFPHLNRNKKIKKS